MAWTALPLGVKCYWPSREPTLRRSELIDSLSLPTHNSLWLGATAPLEVSFPEEWTAQ